MKHPIQRGWSQLWGGHCWFDRELATSPGSRAGKQGNEPSGFCRACCVFPMALNPVLQSGFFPRAFFHHPLLPGLLLRFRFVPSQVDSRAKLKGSRQLASERLKSWHCDEPDMGLPTNLGSSLHRRLLGIRKKRVDQKTFGPNELLDARQVGLTPKWNMCGQRVLKGISTGSTWSQDSIDLFPPQSPRAQNSENSTGLKTRQLAGGITAPLPAARNPGPRLLLQNLLVPLDANGAHLGFGEGSLAGWSRRPQITSAGLGSCDHPQQRVGSSKWRDLKKARFASGLVGQLSGVVVGWLTQTRPTTSPTTGPVQPKKPSCLLNIPGHPVHQDA